MSRVFCFRLGVCFGALAAEVVCMLLERQYYAAAIACACRGVAANYRANYLKAGTMAEEQKERGLTTYLSAATDKRSNFPLISCGSFS